MLSLVGFTAGRSGRNNWVDCHLCSGVHMVAWSEVGCVYTTIGDSLQVRMHQFRNGAQIDAVNLHGVDSVCRPCQAVWPLTK
jgi:hypothetical protein